MPGRGIVTKRFWRWSWWRLSTLGAQDPRRSAWLGTVAALVAIGGAILTVVLQAHLGRLAEAGASVASVRANPWEVAGSYAASGATAALLAAGSRWIRQASRLTVQSPPRPVRRHPSDALYSAPIPRVPNGQRRIGIPIVLGVSAGLAAMAGWGAQSATGQRWAQWIWLGGMALMLGAAVVASRSRPDKLLLRGLRTWTPDALPLVGLVVLSLALRLPHLADLPAVVHGDEAACGLEARRWLSGGVPSLLALGWYGLPMGGYGIPALVMRVVGDTLWGLRFSSVLVGTLAVVAVYGLVRALPLRGLSHRRVALFAAALTAISHVLVAFSRTGFHYIHAVALVPAVLWALVVALRVRSPLAAALVGVGLSLSLQVYFSARILWVIVPGFLLLLGLVNRPALRGRGCVLGWMVLSTLVADGPLLAAFRIEPDALGSRAGQVFIFNLTPDLRAHLLSQFGTANPWLVLWRQVSALPLLPSGLADQSLQYGPAYAFLDPLMAGLALIGLWRVVAMAASSRQPASLLLLAWLATGLAGGEVLTIDQPWWPRLAVVVPALAILAALALEEVCTLLADSWQILVWSTAFWDGKMQTPRQARCSARVSRMAGALLAVTVLVGSGSWTISHYVDTYAQALSGDVSRMGPTVLARQLAALPAGTPVAVYTDGSLSGEYVTTQFLAPQVHPVDLKTVDELTTWTWRVSREMYARGIVVILPAQLATFWSLVATTPDALPPGRFMPARSMGGGPLLAYPVYQFG